MLVFWKFEGDGNDTILHNITTYKVTGTDRIINYATGTILIFCFLISSSLNPVLLYHHRSTGKRRLTSQLFSCLAVSDFLTNLITPLVYAAFMVRAKLFSESEPILSILIVFSCTAGCFSQCLTTLLAITRLMKIVNPFVNINGKVLVVYVVVYTIIMFITAALMAIHVAAIHLIKFEIILLITCGCLNAIHCLLGTICSVITVIYAFFVKSLAQTNEVKKRASVTILLVNIVYVIGLICFLLNYLQFFVFSPVLRFDAINFLFLPVLTSAINPVILFLRVRAIRQACLKLIKFLSGHLNLIDIEIEQRCEGTIQNSCGTTLAETEL